MNHFSRHNSIRLSFVQLEMYAFELQECYMLFLFPQYFKLNLYSGKKPLKITDKIFFELFEELFFWEFSDMCHQLPNINTDDILIAILA